MEQLDIVIDTRGIDTDNILATNTNTNADSNNNINSNTVTDNNTNDSVSVSTDALLSYQEYYKKILKSEQYHSNLRDSITKEINHSNQGDIGRNVNKQHSTSNGIGGGAGSDKYNNVNNSISNNQHYAPNDQHNDQYHYNHTNNPTNTSNTSNTNYSINDDSYNEYIDLINRKIPNAIPNTNSNSNGYGASNSQLDYSQFGL